MTTGEFLAQLRKERGLTQQAVADALNLTNKTISKWERNEGMPDVHSLVDIADLFGVTVDEILRGERASTQNLEFKYKELVQERLKHDYWISITLLVLGVLVFMGVYFTFRKFPIAFCLQLCFFFISLIYMMISLSKAKRGQIDTKYTSHILIQEIKFIVLLIVLVLPCSFNNYKGVEVYFTFTQYLAIMPYILTLLTVLYLIIEMIFHWKKGIKKNRALHCLVALSILSCGGYFLTYHSQYEKVVYKSEEAYDDFVVNYYFIYNNLANRYSFPEIEKEASRINPDYIDNYLNYSESREKYFGVMGFDSDEHAILYRKSETERNLIQNIFKGFLLVSDSLMITFYIKWKSKEQK